MACLDFLRKRRGVKGGAAAAPPLHVPTVPRIAWPDLRHPSDDEVALAIRSVPTHYAAAKFPQTPRSVRCLISAANTNRDGTGTIVSGLTGAATGTEVHRVRIAGMSTVTEGMIRVYVYDGTNTDLIDEIKVWPFVPTAVMPTFLTVWTPPGGVVLLPTTSYIIKFSTNNGETFRLIVEAWDY